jgi:phage recombination protein Bet
MSDAQLTALMIVAQQYGLNPWAKEIYAYPDKQNGIVPVVSVDGWLNIINSHPQFDGMEFEQDDEKCTCIIYRKDRTRPTKVTEWLEECRREAFKNNQGYEIKTPWQSHPKRMLRHKAIIQCARIAFGFGGIVDQDDAESFAFIEKDAVTGEIYAQQSSPKAEAEKVIEYYSNDDFIVNSDKWRGLIESNVQSAETIISGIQKRSGKLFSDDQKDQIWSWGVVNEA